MVVVADPVHAPLQAMFVCEPPSVSVPLDAMVTAMVDAGEQESWSVTVTVYVPGHRLFAVAALPPDGAQLYVNGPVPPVVVTVADPVQPEHPLFVLVVLSVSAVAQEMKSMNTPES